MLEVMRNKKDNNISKFKLENEKLFLLIFFINLKNKMYFIIFFRKKKFVCNYTNINNIYK